MIRRMLSSPSSKVVFFSGARSNRGFVLPRAFNSVFSFNTFFNTFTSHAIPNRGFVLSRALNVGVFVSS